MLALWGHRGTPPSMLRIIRRVFGFVQTLDFSGFFGVFYSALHRTRRAGLTEMLETPRFRGGHSENCAGIRGDWGAGVQTRYGGDRWESKGEGCLLNCKR